MLPFHITTGRKPNYLVTLCRRLSDSPWARHRARWPLGDWPNTKTSRVPRTASLVRQVNSHSQGISSRMAEDKGALLPARETLLWPNTESMSQSSHGERQLSNTYVSHSSREAWHKAGMTIFTAKTCEKLLHYFNLLSSKDSGGISVLTT